MSENADQKGRKGNSTIWVPASLKEELDELKIHKNQAYYEIIYMLLEEKRE